MSEVSGANLNVRYITTPGIYVVRDSDDVINCDTINGVIALQLQNIKQSGLLLNLRTVFINDIGGNVSANNIVIQTTGTDTVNGLSSVSISVNNGALAFDVAGNTEWIAVGNGIPSGGGASWALNGNTNLTEKYIGTNNNFDFPFVVNGSEAMRILANGNFVIGTNSSSVKFYVQANSSLDYIASFANINTNGCAGISLGDGTISDFRIYRVGDTCTLFNSDYQNSALFSITPASSGSVTKGYFFATPKTSSQYFRLIADDVNYSTGLSTTYFVGTPTGNIGIGMSASNPTSKLHVQGIDASSVNYALVIQDNLTNPLFVVRNDGNVYAFGGGGVTTNTAFGIRALQSNTSGSNNSAFGAGAMQNGNISYSSAFGTNSLGLNTGGYNDAFGNYSQLFSYGGSYNSSFGSFSLQNGTGIQNVAFGYASLSNATGNNNTAIGYNTATSLIAGSNNILIGASSNVVNGAISNSLVIGVSAIATASNQAIFASTGAGLLNYYFGNGVSQTSFSNPITFQPTSISSGQTNVSPSDFIFQGSQGTGTGSGGSLIFQISPSGTSGSSQNPLVEAMRIKSNGWINMSMLQVGNSGLSSGDLYVDTAANILANGDKIVARKV